MAAESDTAVYGLPVQLLQCDAPDVLLRALCSWPDGFIAYWDDLKKFHFAAMFVIGWLMGGPGSAGRKAMALGTSVRNTGVGLVIVADNFANTAAVPTVTVFALVMTIVAIVCSFPLRKI